MSTEERVQERLKEWTECRSSIGRFDQVIVDLRKYGFSIITGLLTADTFFLVKSEGISVWQSVALYAVMAVLIFALFTVDQCFEMFLRGAVERASELEKEHDMGITRVISEKSGRANTDTWGRRTYSLFEIAAALPATVSILGAAKVTTQSVVALMFVLVVLMLSLIFIRKYYNAARRA